MKVSDFESVLSEINEKNQKSEELNDEIKSLKKELKRRWFDFVSDSFEEVDWVPLISMKSGGYKKHNKQSQYEVHLRSLWLPDEIKEVRDKLSFITLPSMTRFALHRDLILDIEDDSFHIKASHSYNGRDIVPILQFIDENNLNIVDENEPLGKDVKISRI